MPATSRTGRRPLTLLAGLSMVLCGAARTEPLTCDFRDYSAFGSLRAEAVDGDVLVEWGGARIDDGAGPADAPPGSPTLRASFGLQQGQPIIRQMAVLSRAGHWAPLVRDARPEFHVVEGMRRISNQQLNPMRDLGREATPEVVEQEKWKVFWDAPLNVPGLEGVNPGCREVRPKCSAVMSNTK